jgi:hypothetical protein
MTIGRLRIIVGAIIGLAAIWFWLVYPALEQSARQAPVIQAIEATEQGNLAKIRDAFTADGTVKLNAPLMVEVLLQGDAIPIDRALKLVGNTITGHAGEYRLRFEGFINEPIILRDRMEADIAVVGQTPQSDEPNRWVPFRRTAHVKLVKVGFLQWKIQEISSSEGDFDAVMGNGE